MIRFTPSGAAGGGGELVYFGSEIVGIRLSSEQAAAALAAGSVTVTLTLGNPTGIPNPTLQVFIIQATGAAFGAQTTISVTSTGTRAVTLPVTANGVRQVRFGLHTQLVQSARIGDLLELGGWLDNSSRLPSGAIRVSPSREEYHSVSGLFLGVSTPPTSEEIILAIRGIPGASMRDAGAKLVDLLSFGEVDFEIETPIPGQSSFRAWADGSIGQPQIRRGNQYDWDLSLRVAR